MLGQVAKKYLGYEQDVAKKRKLPLTEKEWYFSVPPRQTKAEALGEGEASAIYLKLIELGLLEGVKASNLKGVVKAYLNVVDKPMFELAFAFFVISRNPLTVWAASRTISNHS